MSLQGAEAVAFVLQSYLAVGLLFAALFLPFGASRVDPHLVGAPLAVRALILPGVALFWPLLAWRWVTGRQAPIESNPHRAAAARERRQ